MKEVNPYEKLAFIYDQLMDHVDYENWALYILSLINRLEMNINSVIDLSCGTGSLLFHVKNNFEKTYGCDQASSMIALAREKHSQTPLFTNDVRRMAIKDNSVDCALFLYDSLNYITQLDDLKGSLKEVHRILTADGLFIFDIVSASHCREHYADYHESEYWDNVGYNRHSYYNQEKGMQFNDFRIVINGKTYFEKHSQRVYSVEFLSDILTEHSFEIVNIFDEFSFEKADKESGRMHLVCKCR